MLYPYKLEVARFYKRCAGEPNCLWGACSPKGTFRRRCIARQRNMSAAMLHEWAPRGCACSTAKCECHRDKSDFARFYKRCAGEPNCLWGVCSPKGTFRRRCIARQRDMSAAMLHEWHRDKLNFSPILLFLLI